MYLREMGGVELLSREGEIAIAKRIEAGKDYMINGLFQSPLTAQKVFEWKEKLEENKLLIREIIDIDSSYLESETENEDEHPNSKKDKIEQEDSSFFELVRDCYLDIAKSDSNEERIMLKQFQKKDSYKELGTMNQRIIELEKDEEVLSDKDKKIDEQLTKLETDKYDLVKKLYKIDETYDIDDLHNKQSDFTNENHIEKKKKLRM